jgi:Tfp pilus assembly protein PilP
VAQALSNSSDDEVEDYSSEERRRAKAGICPFYTVQTNDFPTVPYKAFGILSEQSHSRNSYILFTSRQFISSSPSPPKKADTTILPPFLSPEKPQPRQALPPSMRLPESYGALTAAVAATTTWPHWRSLNILS